MEIKHLQSILRRNANEIKRLWNCYDAARFTLRNFGRDELYFKVAMLAKKKAIELGKLQKVIKDEMKLRIIEKCYDRQVNGFLRGEQ